MLRLAIVSLLISMSVEAAHLDTVCKSALEAPPLFAEGVVARVTNQNKNVIETMEGKEIFSSQEKINSIIVQDKKIWVLTLSKISVLNLDGSFIKDLNYPNGISMTMAGEILVVIKADRTVGALNTKTGEVLWNSSMRELPVTEPVSATFDGTNVQMIFAPWDEGGFTGVATIEASTGKVLGSAPYLVRRYGIVAPDAIAHWNDGKLIINNSGWIHEITAKQIQDGKALKPRWVAVEVRNGSDPHYMMLLGDFLLEGNTAVGCGRFHEGTGHDWELKSGLFKVAL